SGRTVERCGSPAVQGLVRSLVVVQPAESVKGPLLGDARRARWANGLTLESFVHALVSAILVRRGRENPLVPNAQALPPHVQLREPMNPGGREGHPIVRANRAWQPMLAKQPVEDRTHAVAFRREQAVAGQEIAGVVVGHR